MPHPQLSKNAKSRISEANAKRLKKGMWEGRPTAAQISYLLQENASLKLALGKMTKDRDRWQTFKQGRLE